MVTVENISKSFGPTAAVKDLSFGIESGQIVGFLGPNGAGKTTTMRLITGYYTPDTGAIKINGVNIEENPIETQKLIGYLPENNPLYKDMLVSELLSLTASLYKMTPAEKKAALDFVIPAVGLEKYFYRQTAELSKGYKQRVGIAMALLHQPHLLIMDEPTEGLDPNQRTEIRALIKDLAKDRTIIMSTHVMQEVTAVCNRILIINHGSIVADGSAEELTKLTADTTTVSIRIEGLEVIARIKGIPGVTHVELITQEGNHTHAHVVSSNQEKLQPHLARLAKEHNWVLWQINEERKNLEDIFHSLTQE